MRTDLIRLPHRRPGAPATSPPPVPAALTAPRAVAHYVGALFGPSLLLLPGLAAREAGPASVLAWAALLVLSALTAVVFSGLGTALGSAAGVAGYAAAGLGGVAGRVTGWSFFAAVVAGVPVVCLIGGQYLATAVGRPSAATPAAAVLLLLVLAMRLAGAHTGSRLQLALVAMLLVLLVTATAGTLGAVRAAHWHPFLPHGLTGVGRAAGHLMLAFVGWEAAAPLTVRLADPARLLPRVIGAAFAVTAVGYLALAASTVAVLGGRAGTATPLSALLDSALGPAGSWLAATAAVLLTLGVTNAYLQGAAATADHLLHPPGSVRSTATRHLLTLGVAGFGAALLALSALHVVGLSLLVALPTMFFLLVYLACMLAGARRLRGPVRVAAALAAAAVAALLAAGGVVAVLVAGFAAAVGATRVYRLRRQRRLDPGLALPDRTLATPNVPS